MNNCIKLLLTSICIIVFAIANAQQDAQFSQYMFNNMYNNPGYAGLEDTPKFIAIHRSQWVGYDGNNPPRGQVLTASIPMRILSGGIGIHIENDELGPYRKVNFLLSYSYHINLGEGKLGIGFRSGFANTSINARYLATDPIDPNIPSGANQLTPDYALGVFYNHRAFYFGVGLSHFFKQQISELKTQQSRHINVTSGYNYQFSKNIMLTPSFIFKYDEGVGSTGGQWSADGSLMATINNRYWFGASFRKQDAIIPFIGVNLLKNNSLKIGFAYDYTLVNQSAKANSSYEILLSYNLAPIMGKLKPIIRSPRYRFE